MNGGYGADGRGAGDGQDYRGRGRTRREAAAQPPWDDPGARPDQPRGQAGQGSGPGRRGQDWGQGQPQGRGQGYGQQAGRPDPWAQGQYPAGGGQQFPRTGPQPGQRTGPQPGRRGGGPQPAWPGDASQQGYGGTGPRPAQRDPDSLRRPPGGYDPRGTMPRRASDGYPGDGYPGDGYQGRGDARYGQDDYPGRGGEPRRDEEFLPGFGGRDDHGDGRYPDERDGYQDFNDRGGRRGRRARDDRRGRAARGRGDGRGDDGYGDDDWDDRGERRRRRGPVRRLAPWIALLVILTPIVAGGVYVYNLYEHKYHPADFSGPGTGSVTVQVKSGDTAFSLGPRLVTLGVVASARAFELAAEASTGKAGLEAGFYKMHHDMQASLAYAALLDPKNRVQDTLTFPEGLRLSQILALLGARSGIPLSDFRTVLANPAQLGLPPYAHGKPEGYLFPATYQIQPNDTALTVLKAMVQRFDQEAAQVNLSAAAARVHMTSAQVIIVASLVQAEGGRLQDYPKIAEVVYNRLARGMQLKFDSTVFYGLGKYGTSATFAEINTPGPYNTYLNTGLPPGPIDSPGDAAIRAALHPATGNLLYFFSFKNGVTEFSPSPISH